jgi:hypothetical protein
MPSGAADSFTPATTSGLAVAAPAGPGHAAPANTASATLTPPAQIACFRLRLDSLRAVTVTPPFMVYKDPIQAKSVKSRLHQES